MTKKILSTTWALCLGLLLVACGSSPPNNYYLLSPQDFPAPDGEAPSLGVGPIEIPAYLNRENMVYHRAGNTLTFGSVDLWAEPLVDGIQRVLVLNLAGLLNTQDVQYFPWHPKRAPQYAVKVNLLQLEADERQVMLTAEWLVYRPASAGSVQRRISRLQSPLSAGTAVPEEIATTYSALLFQLSELIAAAIKADRADATNGAAQ